jgi:hypothetical protein
MMDVVAAAVATTVLASLAVLQALVAAGRPYGRFVWGGRHDTLPRGLRIASAVSIALYAAMVAVLIARAAEDAADEGSSFVRVATWAIAGYCVLGIPLNAASRSRAERTVMTPTTVVLAACALVLATSG